MGSRVRPDYMLLIRGQVPYKGTWKYVYEQKLREMEANFIRSDVERVMRENPDHAPYDEDPARRRHPRKKVALWFYRGTTTKPHEVSSFVYWYDTFCKERDEARREATGSLLIDHRLSIESFPVYIYFPNELDWYTQSNAEYAHLEYGEDPHAARPFSRRQFTSVSRKNYHDPPGRNVLILSGVGHLHPQFARNRSMALNLSEYEICRGFRVGMNAREYFADGRNGQRVACLKRIKTSEPAHLVRLHIIAYLTHPFALHATRK